MTEQPDPAAFRAAKVSPLVEEVFGQAWAAIAWREGHRAKLPKMERWTLIRDGGAVAVVLARVTNEWQTSKEIAADAELSLCVVRNVLTNYYEAGKIERRQPNSKKDGFQWRWRSGSTA